MTFRGVVDQGSLQGQVHVLKYRKPEDDPQREIETLEAACPPNVVGLLQVNALYGNRRAIALAFLDAHCDLEASCVAAQVLAQTSSCLTTRDTASPCSCWPPLHMCPHEA